VCAIQSRVCTLCHPVRNAEPGCRAVITGWPFAIWAGKINTILMYYQKKTTRKKLPKKRKTKSYSKKDPYGYQPDSPLTQHYLTTGAILPEKKKIKI